MASSKRHTCLFCSSGFSTRDILFNHIRKHTQEKPFACKKCDNVFNHLGTLKMHMYSHSERRPHKCDECPKSYKILFHLTAHQRRGHKVYNCSHCQRSFKNLQNLNYHVACAHSPNESRPFGCEICGKRFITNCEYLRHLRRHIKEKPINCEICAKSFALNSYLASHKKIHGAPQFYCESCPAAFVTRNQLKTHKLRMHTKSSEVHPCPVCKMEFRMKKDMTSHKLGHVEGKPFQCSKCLARFKRKKNLVSHTKLMHEPREFWKCPRCPKTFKTKQSVNRHVSENHSGGERPFQCLFCSYRAFRSDMMTAHIKSHTKEKPYFCELCDFSYSTAHALDGHFRSIHTLERPFTCEPGCGKAFAGRQNLKVHRKRWCQVIQGTSCHPRA